MGKKLVLCKKSSKLATSRNVKTFFGSMGDTYKGSRNSINCKGVQDTFSKKSNTDESSPDAKNGSGTSRSNTSEDGEHVEEGNHTANRASDWGVFKQYFLGWEKRWDKLTCGELKILKPVYSISAFQNGRFVLPPQITATGRLHVLAGYERCLFFSSTASVIKKLCSVFMVRESLRVPLIMFRLGTSSQNLHKIAKNTSVCPEQDKYLDSNVLDNILMMGQTMEEILMSRDTVIFLLQHLGFVLNMERSILNPVQEIEFLGVTINSLCLSLPQEVLKFQSQCQDVHAKGQVTVHKLRKLSGLLASTIQEVLPAQVNFDIFSNSK